MSYNTKVREFYHAFDQDEFIPSSTGLTDDVISAERLDLKTTLIAEEFFELVEAVYGAQFATQLQDVWEQRPHDPREWNRDVVAAADATGDLFYVLEGFNLEAGIPSEAVFDEIHGSNMSKLQDGKPLLSRGLDIDGKPLGKILKGDGFYEPDLYKVLGIPAR